VLKELRPNYKVSYPILRVQQRPNYKVSYPILRVQQSPRLTLIHWLCHHGTVFIPCKSASWQLAFFLTRLMVIYYTQSIA